MTDQKKLTAKDYKAVVAKNGGVPFHEQQAAQAKADPSNERHQAAREAGLKEAADFLSKVRDFTAPGHEEALSRYKSDFGMDENNVCNFFMDRMARMMGTAPYEMKNAAYENKVLSNYTVANSDDASFLAKLTDMLRSKWSAVGYAGDAQVIGDFEALHPFSRPPKAMQRIS